MKGMYVVLMAEQVDEVAAFYERWFGFERSFTSDWYVSLVRESDGRRFELAVMLPKHETVPQGFGGPTSGVIVSFEVEDATEEHQRIIVEGSMHCVQELRDEVFGQRHFMLADPAGNLVDVIQIIPPSEEFAAQYLGS